MTSYEFGFAQEFFVHGSSSLKRVEIIQVDNRISLMKGGIVKPPLWQPSNQGHLPSLESQPNVFARARLLAVMPFGAGVAVTGAFNVPQALHTLSRSRSRSPREKT